MTRNKLSGFTIVELLIVIVVIGVLAAITIVAYNGIQSRAADTKLVSDSKAVVTGAKLKKVDTGYMGSGDDDPTDYSTRTSTLSAYKVESIADRIYIVGPDYSDETSNASEYFTPNKTKVYVLIGYQSLTVARWSNQDDAWVRDVFDDDGTVVTSEEGGPFPD